MPRAALLSIHARVAGTGPDTLDDPTLVQLWGPRFSAYAVAADAVAPFTLGRLPDGGPELRRAEDLAERLHAFLDGATMTYGEAGRGLGVHPNALRYAAPTGTVLIRWDGARQPTIWTVPRPDTDPIEARLELVRRYLHVMGPGSPTSFSKWAGVRPPRSAAAFEALADELIRVRTPIGDSWILAEDEASFQADPGPTAPARLLPSGDTYTLLQGADRELLVPEPGHRAALWTPRVWPGSVLVEGEIAGTWRRDHATVTVEAWSELAPPAREIVEAEAASMPLPGIGKPISVRWA